MKKTQTQIYCNYSRNKKPTRGLKTNQKAGLAHRLLILRNGLPQGAIPIVRKPMTREPGPLRELWEDISLFGRETPQATHGNSAMWALPQGSSLEADCLHCLQHIFKQKAMHLSLSFGSLILRA